MFSFLPLINNSVATGLSFYDQLYQQSYCQRQLIFHIARF